MSIRQEKENGMPVARIAARYGISRQSVYNVMNGGSGGRERTPRASVLDPFKPYVRSRLARFDLPATVLLREIQRQGYGGGISVLKEFVAGVKTDLVRLVIERFETLPGVQAQLDWGECGTIVEHGVPRRLYLFVFVLGFSRVTFARFTTSMRQPELLSCTREAFEKVGVPQELLVDNMKTAVDRHLVGEEVRFNAGFLSFCEHYGSLPVACPPYWPRAKGKVEAGVKYLKRSFLAGRSFTDLADLNAQLDAWLDCVANVRVHDTTGERPIDRYERERAELRPAAALPAFDTRELLIRLVPSDAHVRVAGGAYSVPPRWVGRSVHVRVRRVDIGQAFEVIAAGDVIARHTIAGKRVRVTLPEHAQLIRIAAKAARRPQRPKATFEQLPEQALPNPVAGGFNTLAGAPVVQVRDLAEFELAAVA